MSISGVNYWQQSFGILGLSRSCLGSNMRVGSLEPKAHPFAEVLEGLFPSEEERPHHEHQDAQRTVAEHQLQCWDQTRFEVVFLGGSESGFSL